MKLIEQNPFRMLGIAVNAGAKELAGNLGKKKLLDIGKEVSFPLDLTSFFTPINRTSAAMDAANAAINQPKDKVRHALFWFAKPTGSMGDAYNHLLDGDIDKAAELFAKSKSWESKLCLSVIELQKGRTSESVSIVANEIIGNDANRNAFLDAVAGQTFKIDRQGLYDLYFGALSGEVDMSDLLSANVPGDVSDLIKQKSVGKPIADIEAAVSKAKAVDDEDYLAQLNAGRQLWKDTRKPLQQLKQALGESDLQYARLADKVANQILQCSINYHNAIDNSTDEPVTAAVVDKCIEMAECADNLCVGRITKERIEKNLEILREKKKRLPPAGVESEVAAILRALKTFVSQPDKIEHSVTLLNTTKPHLQSIKQKLGGTNVYYQQISSQVVGNAMHNLIAEVNEAQESEVVDLGGTRYRVSSDKTKAAVRAAWNCTKIMDDFAMDAATKSHFDTNKRTLRNMCSQLGVSTSSVPPSAPSTRSSHPKDFDPISSGATPSTSTTSTKKPSGGNSGGGDGPSGCLITTILLGLIGGIIVAVSVHSFWGFVVVNLIVWGSFFRYAS